MAIGHLTQAMNNTSTIVLSALALLSTFVVYELIKAIYNAFFGPLAKIPGPFVRRFTIIPHALAVARGEQHLDIGGLHEKYGPVVRFGPNHVIFGSGKEAWKDIYGSRKGGVLPKDPLLYGMTVNGAHSVASADAVDHARQRKVFSTAFSDRALKAQEPMIKTWAGKLSDKLQIQATSGAKTDMLKWYNCTTFDVMAELTFGEPLNMLEESEYTPWVKTIFTGIKSSTIMRSFKHLGALPSYLIDDVLFKTKMVRERMLEHWQYSASRVDARLASKTTKPDIWSLVDGKDQEHGGLNLGEHHANGNLFMIAGTETTATALSGVTYFLCKSPKAMGQLVSEVREHVKDFDGLKLETLARLKYLNAVLQEGLRLYPPAPIDLPRVVPRGGAVVDGYFLPAGTKTGIGHYAMYRMSQHFKEPNEFRPERWLGDPKYKDDNLSVVEPFSIGPRNCLGKNLAWHEMRILLATVFLQFDVSLLPESHQWIDQKVYTLFEKKPLWCTLRFAQK